METQTHKILDFLQHIWPYVYAVVTGLGVMFVAMIRFAWHRHKELKEQQSEQAAAIIAINENMVTTPQLHACREDVRDDDEKNLDLIFNEIRDLRKEARTEAAANAKQHKEIMTTSSQNYKELMGEILRIHANDK